MQVVGVPKTYKAGMILGWLIAVAGFYFFVTELPVILVALCGGKIVVPEKFVLGLALLVVGRVVNSMSRFVAWWNRG